MWKISTKDAKTSERKTAALCYSTFHSFLAFTVLSEQSLWVSCFQMGKRGVWLSFSFPSSSVSFMEISFWDNLLGMESQTILSLHSPSCQPRKFVSLPQRALPFITCHKHSSNELMWQTSRLWVGVGGNHSEIRTIRKKKTCWFIHMCNMTSSTFLRGLSTCLMPIHDE